MSSLNICNEHIVNNKDDSCMCLMSVIMITMQVEEKISNHPDFIYPSKIFYLVPEKIRTKLTG